MTPNDRRRQLTATSRVTSLVRMRSNSGERTRNDKDGLQAGQQYAIAIDRLGTRIEAIRPPSLRGAEPDLQAC